MTHTKRCLEMHNILNNLGIDYACRVVFDFKYSGHADYEFS
jgi:hypothetical protein